MPDYTLETARGGLVAGIDEVGRGPLAGPVVAAAVVFTARPPKKLASLVDDSKKLNAVRRETAFAALTAYRATRLGIGAASVSEIERLNIAGATHLAMRRALARLAVRLGRMPDLALVDGNHAPSLPCPVETIVGGDGLSLSIAAASILAKVVRDRAMGRLAARYGAYGWESNVGYSTAAHLAALRSVGASCHHRMGFAPVRALFETDLLEEVSAA